VSVPSVCDRDSGAPLTHLHACAGGFLPILSALGKAALKACVCIGGIILAGRTLLRPVMRRIASLENAEIFAATTLLVILGCSALTQVSGLSLALGAFLAGLLMAETEYALQVRGPLHACTVCTALPPFSCSTARVGEHRYGSC
jgi:Kef-type K+ transport system membrane component KefB